MIIKKVCSAFVSITVLLAFAGCNVSETAQNATSTAKEKAEQAKNYVVSLYNQVDMNEFKKGWDSAVDFVSSKYSAVMGSKYVEDVGEAINKLKEDINKSAGSARNTAQEAGYVAEKWVADTFNIDAVANGSSNSANVVGSNGMGSPDVSTSYNETASLKYYKTGSKSAAAQATNFLKEYSQYTSKSKNPISLEEYLDKHNKDLTELYASIYQDQKRIIPADQYEDAVNYLKGKIDKLSDHEQSQYAQTLENLKTKLEAPDGTSSKAASYEEMQAIAELAKNGDFDPSDFGITTSQIITPKYLVKCSIKAGLSSAALNTVLSIGPDIFSILKNATTEGSFDETQLKETGIEGLLSASEGFVEGSISCAILTACQAGKLGAELKEVSPDTIGTLTFLAIDAIRYGYSLSKGEITPLDYSNLMAEDVFVAVVSQASGAALQTLLPAIPFAYMAGSLAGGMVASVDFQLTKELVLEIKDSGGFEAIVPTGVVNTMNVITDKVSSLNIKEQLTTFEDMTISTANDGYIKIKSLLQ